MRKTLFVAMLAMFVALSSGCATMSQHGNKIGAIAGAAIGYSVGGKHKILAAVLGGGIGWKVGDMMAKRFGPRDVAALDTTLRNNAAGETSRWGAADGSYYELTPKGDGYTPKADGREARAIPASDISRSYCREFTLNIVMVGRTENGYGIACMMPDGSWRIVG